MTPAKQWKCHFSEHALDKNKNKQMKEWRTKGGVWLVLTSVLPESIALSTYSSTWPSVRHTPSDQAAQRRWAQHWPGEETHKHTINISLEYHALLRHPSCYKRCTTKEQWAIHYSWYKMHDGMGGGHGFHVTLHKPLLSPLPLCKGAPPFHPTCPCYDFTPLMSVAKHDPAVLATLTRCSLTCQSPP